MDRKSRLVAELKLLESGKKFLDESKKSIPLDKVKQAREEIENINLVYLTIGDRIPVLKNCDDIKAEVLEILDKLIEESEG